MTQVHRMKQNDLLPQLQATLLSNAVAIDLTTAYAVRFFMRNGDGVKVDGGACDIDPDPTTGQVGYSWADGDTDTAGGFNGEFEVIWGSGKRQTFPGDSYIKVKILADIGDGSGPG